ncbi:MAG: sensor histidine kinase [bacterium]|jgi:two-component system sensor histidine kinase UhpB
MAFATDRELTGFLAETMNAQELEGARISRLLHDEVGQVLSAIGLQLDLLRMDISEGSQSASGRIVEIQRLLETAIGRVRDLSYELNPCAAGRAGLEPSLKSLADRYRTAVPAGIAVTCDPAVRPDAAVAAVMFRIAQLALDNAVRHAGATRIDVFVKKTRAGVSLIVRDDGRGFSPRAESIKPRGLGLRLMRRHASAAGLRFSLVSAPGRGTIVKVIQPVPTPGGQVA